MQSCSHVPGEQHVAGDNGLFGDGGPPRKPEFAREHTLVHVRALREARFLSVLSDHTVKSGDVLEGPAHDERIMHAVAVVAEDPHGGCRAGHGADLSELLAGEPDGHGADGPYGCVAVPLSETLHLLDDAGGVGNG